MALDIVVGHVEVEIAGGQSTDGRQHLKAGHSGVTGRPDQAHPGVEQFEFGIENIELRQQAETLLTPKPHDHRWAAST